MRYGVISDVHGNLHALQAALAVLSRTRVDEYLCAGDLVGYGPLPNECVARVAEIGARCVAGNHDLITLGRISGEGCSRLARDSLRWTREELNEESCAFLERLPGILDVGGGVVMAHGSLSDPREYVKQPHERAAELRVLQQTHPDARMLVLGHTHHHVAHAESVGTLTSTRGSVSLAPHEKYLLNPGSVGQSREHSARARFMVIDLERSRASFHAVRYNALRCRRALRRRGLPWWSCHLKPRPVRDQARELVRTVGLK